MKIRPGLPRAALMGCIGAGFLHAANAAEWSQTGAWLLHGDDFKPGPGDVTILRLEHASGWQYGDNYFFVDFLDRGRGDTTLYGEFAPRLSLGKMTGTDLSVGPVSDWLLAGAVNAGEDFRAYLYGFGIDLSVPGFSYLQLNAYLRDDRALPGTSWQLTPVWHYPFSIGGLKFEFQGFIDFIGGEGPAHHNIVAAPRLWLDLGALWEAPGRVHVGFEYWYWRNKFGIEGLDESVVQPSIRWTF